MTDQLKLYNDLQYALSEYQRFAESPIVRLQHEMKLAVMRQGDNQRVANSVSLMSVDKAKALASQRRLADEIAAMQKALHSNRVAVDEFANLFKHNALFRPFPLADVFEQMRVRVGVISFAYRDYGSQLRSFALIPSTFSATHIARTASLIGTWKQRCRAVEPLLASISFTDSQVSSQEADILDYPDVFDFSELEDDETGESILPTQNLYYVQRSELILMAKKTPHFLEDEHALSSLPSMQYFNVAQSVCRLVTIINRQCAVSGSDGIFRLTNRFAESLIALPNVVAVDQQRFAEFVDYLYFIVYEGAGKDNLRLLDVIDKDDAEPVWVLKHLRNYLTRHDVEHGKDTEIKKKQERLGQIFSTLISKPLPRSRRDFGNAQLRFLQHIEAMLKKVSEELARRATLAKPAASEEST